MDDLNLDLFPDDWDIDNENHYNYYKKCSPYVKNSEDFDNIINKSVIFYIFGISAILYFIVLTIILLRNRNHFIFKRQGRIYFFLYMFGSTLSSMNSFMVQVIYFIYKIFILVYQAYLFFNYLFLFFIFIHS